MLKINLLPPEKRRLKRTPYYALVPLVVSILLLAGSLVAGGYFYLEDQRLQEDIRQREMEVEDLRPAVEEHAKLTAMISGETARISSIELATKRNVYWGDLLAALVEVTSKNPRIWLDEIVYLDAGRAQAEHRRYNPQAPERPPYGIRLKCNAVPDMVEDPKDPKKAKAAPNVAVMVKFRKDLREHPKLVAVFGDFHPKIPEWNWVSDDSKEGNKMTFDVILIAR
jgi:hypothetical protein